MDRYFNTFEKEIPDFAAKLWLGDDFVGKFEFKGRTVDSQEINVPMQFLLENQESKQILMEKEGKGRLYWRVSLDYAPLDLNLNAANYGFGITREYTYVDNKTDVSKENGVWKFKSGARVQVVLKFVNKNRNYHVAMVDKLPAGLEALNSALKGTTGVSDVVENKKYWVEHENFRDERVEAFTSFLYSGEHVYKYIARATAKGEFVVPPAKVEEMYSPDVFGRTATDHVIIH